MLMREGKYLDVSRWTSHFTLILPYEFKEDREGFDVAQLCGKVEVDPQPPPAGTVVLYQVRGRQARGKTAKVTPASHIEFLEGCRGEGYKPPYEYTEWIHVRVDGQDGWVPSEETDALGLPSAD
jgi:hypothetical protein